MNFPAAVIMPYTPLRFPPGGMYAALVLAGALLFAGCGGTERPEDKYPEYTSYRDIPGITEEETAAIESLRARRNGFAYGMTSSTEAFYNTEGQIEGYAALFCRWLTDLFGIPFTPAIYEWDHLLAGLESRDLDFSGELTATEERRDNYYMTGAIAERSVKCMRIDDGGELAEIAKSRPLRYAFLEGVITYDQVARYDRYPFEAVFISDYETAYGLLKNGEADAFLDEGVAEAGFDVYGDVTAEDFFPPIYSPVSLATQNPELEPVISAVQKALLNGASYQLSVMYNQGQRDYLRHKLFTRLTEEEREYIQDRIQSNSPVPVAAEYETYPVSFYNDKEKAWQGVAFDVFAEIQALTGISFVTANQAPVDWLDLLAMLETGEVPMITELIRTEEREGRFIWPAVSFQTDYYALLSRLEYKNININEVLYSRVGLIKGSAYTEVFNAWFPNHHRAKEYGNNNEAFAALERGEVDLVMATRNILLGLTNLEEKLGFKVNLAFQYPYESTFGFNRDEDVLCSIVTKALRLIDTETIVDGWTRRVFDYRGKMARAQIPWLVGVSALLFCLLALLFVMLLWHSREKIKLETTVRERTAELVKEDQLLHTVNDAASLLLAASDADKFEDALRQGMEMMARGVGIDRIYLWKNFLRDDLLYYRQIFEWLDTGAAGGDTVRAVMGDSCEFSYAESIPEWEAKLSGGLCVNGPVNTLSRVEQRRLAPYGITSILVIPVILRDTFWGFVSFDDCSRERTFSKDEEDILRSGSLLLVNAVLRNETNQAFRDAAARAEAASRAKSDFLSNMSHEIRTPMNAIIGMTSIAKSSSDAERKEYCLNKIKDASEYLLGVINDILDMSKIEANRFELSIAEFDFEKMLRKVTDIINFRVDEKHQNFTVHIDRYIPRHVEGDDPRIAQVLINLLGNAIKFTPDGGSISLETRLLKEEAGICTIQVAVRDTGIGIPEEQQARIFTSFEQAESSTSRRFGGTGLGLAIAKRIVELMNGKIWLESAPGQGSAFYFTIQVKTGQENRQILLNPGVDNLLRVETEESSAGAIDAFPGRRVLLAEDVEINREIVSALLESASLSIDCAGNGAEAVKKFTAAPESYDMIFMDIQMPEMDGYEAARNIRAFEKSREEKNLREIPIVAMTANVFREDITKCLEAGMNDHVGKPLDFEEVLEKLRLHLPHRNSDTNQKKVEYNHEGKQKNSLG
jgi:signal transduction histidine kinase/ABC-type amino acid transport substrate-binding protein/AmiR/NasT family two-component response regulator